MSPYSYNEKHNFYFRPEKKGIGYEDGGEQKLLQILDSVTDKSTLSEEFLPFINDWPSEYHLSRKRHLILRPLGIKPGDRVLELGCGCGSITRYLVEIGAKVTAVEGEISRIAVASKRCEGFTNVNFIADDFLDLEINEKFDWVLMIGVLEYSQRYVQSSNPQKDYIQIVKKYLRESGTFVIAIENKLGIKYLNGASEDHNSKRFYGTQDLYSGRDVTTWGKKELKDLLIQEDFKNIEFYGVFPDYKLPKVIFNEEILNYKNFRAEELLLHIKSLDYSGFNERFYDEAFTMGSFRKNGLMIDLSNSFLVTAKLLSEKNLIRPKELAYYYAIDRKERYCTQTIFSGSDNSIRVKKNLINRPSSFNVPIELKSLTNLENFMIKHQVVEKEMDYLEGILLEIEFAKTLNRSDFKEMPLILDQWLGYLIDKFKLYDKKSMSIINPRTLNKEMSLANVLIDGDALDCGPQNLVKGNDLKVFDLEWTSDSPIPLSWVLFRSCSHIYRGGYGNKKIPFDAKDLFVFVVESLSLTATLEDLQEANNLEIHFQKNVGFSEPLSMKVLTNFEGLQA